MVCPSENSGAPYKYFLDELTQKLDAEVISSFFLFQCNHDLLLSKLEQIGLKLRTIPKQYCEMYRKDFKKKLMCLVHICNCTKYKMEQYLLGKDVSDDILFKCNCQKEKF